MRTILAVAALALLAACAASPGASQQQDLGYGRSGPPPPATPAPPSAPPPVAPPPSSGGGGTVVAQSGQLSALLAKAHCGDTIALAPGTYARNVIRGFTCNPPVTITSANRATEAVIKDLVVDKSAGLTFSYLTFDPAGNPLTGSSPAGTINFEILFSSTIVLDHITATMEPSAVLATAESGFLIRGSTWVTVSNSDFSYFHNALGHWQNDHLTIQGNNCHNNFDDCFRGGSSDTLIDSNHCWSNHFDLTDTDHPDCIQYWESGATASFHDITITNNRYDRGTGRPTQAIFFGNHPPFGATGGTAALIPFVGVTISGNTIDGAEGNGILVEVANGLTITNNTVQSYCDIESRIITSGITGETVTGNSAERFGLDGKFDRNPPAGNTYLACIPPTTAVGP
ncbi:MAG: right-handed parallel beta-helix repeat-containing protein [Caulobacteraceae bacterium]